MDQRKLCSWKMISILIIGLFLFYIGSLFRAQLRCWESRQVLDVDGARKAFEVLQQASSSLELVQDKSTESFVLTQGIYFYFEGEIYYQNRDYKKALDCLKSSLDLTEGLLKVDTTLARCYNAIGNCYYALDKTAKALEFYEKAMQMRTELSAGSENHYDLPVYKNQIGTIHEDREEYDKAVECYKDALRLLEELNISGYEDEAIFCRNLANVYVKQGKFREAIKPAHKAYNIRINRLGDHPDTVRSIFQQGVIQANLPEFDKALELFLKGWEMEKSLKPGNHSEVWQLLIKGVNDMCDNLNRSIEKETFRQDALPFCQRFWKEEKESAQFSFTEYNKEIIDTTLSLFGDEEENRAARDEFKEEALWFYDGMQSANEEDFYNKFNQETDNKKLNKLVDKINMSFERTIDFLVRLDEREKVRKHKGNKLMIFQKLLVKKNFVGDHKKGQDKATLKSKVEQLYEDLDEKGSIPEFHKYLLSTWVAQWQAMKGTWETKEIMVAKERTIKGILQLCHDLRKEKVHRRYGKEALIFYERLWEVKHAEMKPPEVKKFLCEIIDLASSVRDHEREKRYRDALLVSF